MQTFKVVKPITHAGGGHKLNIPAIAINSKSGLIRFSHKAAEILSLKENTTISFAQDPKDKAEWAVAKMPDGDFTVRSLRERKGKAIYLGFRSKWLAQALFAAVNYTKDSGRVLLGQETVQVEALNGKKHLGKPLILGYLNRASK